MKTKHWIEAGIVIALFALALFFSLPHFFRAQIPGDAKRLDAYVERLYRFLAEEKIEKLYEIFFYAKNSITVSKSPSYFLNGGSKEVKRPLFFMYKISCLDLDKMEQVFPELSKPEWPHGELRVYVCQAFGKKDPNDASMKNGYNEYPFVISVYARVGKILDSKYTSSNMLIGVDDEGFYTVRPSFTPFDHNKGMDSYGVFYRDSYELWGKEKAVLVNMPNIIP